MAILSILISCFLLLGISECLNISEHSQNRHFGAASHNIDINKEDFAWTCPLKVSDRYLSFSEKWYRFLNSLFCKFSEYEIQVAKRSYNVANLEEWGNSVIFHEDGKKNVTEVREWLDDEEEGININRNNFELFLNKTEEYKIAELENIRNIEVTDVQLVELNHILNLTIKQRLYISCEEPYLYVKGNYVVLSKIHTYFKEGMIDDSCKGRLSNDRVKFINVFALNTIFIDEDASNNGTGKAINFIAPRWVIIGSRKIGMNGDEVESEANKGVNNQYYFHRIDGKPGKSGKPGGNIFGISEEIVNGANLTLFANGGDGSHGQEGGNGRDGKDGIDPSVPSDISCVENLCENNKEINSFRCEKIGCSYTDSTSYAVRKLEKCTFKLFGENGTQGGNGGNGGKGGEGGNQGSVALFELKHSSGVSQISNHGMHGKDGRGGMGGTGGKKGNDIIVSCSPFFFSSKWTLINTLYSTERATPGKNGSDGGIFHETETPDTGSAVNNLDKAAIINQYKRYLRENLNDPVKLFRLRSFLNHLENDNNVKSVYNTFGLIDELKSLDEDFHKLKNDVNFLPFYKSFLNRITEYVHNSAAVVEISLHKKVLGYLYTATLGKIYNLEDDLESHLLLDIDEYLESVKIDLEKLKDIQNTKSEEEVISKHYEEYANEVLSIISKYIHVILDIKTEIDRISVDIDIQTETLINEIAYMRQQIRIEHEQINKKQQQLENALVVQGLVSFLKNLDLVVKNLIPAETIKSSVIESRETIAEIFYFNILDKFGNNTYNVTKYHEELKFLITSIEDQKVAALKNSLQIIASEADKHPDKFSDISVKSTHIRNKLDKIENTSSKFQEVQNLENELQALLNSQPLTLKTKNELSAIENMQKAVQLNSVIMETYNKYQYNPTTLESINNVITKSKHKFHKLKIYEDEMYNTIISMLQNIQNDINITIKTLKENSKVVHPGVTKWKIKSTLEGIMLQTEQFTQEFDKEGKLAGFMENMKDGIIAVINIHEHIKSYKMHKFLSNMIVGINSIPENSTHLNYNEKLEYDLRTALHGLDIMVRSSIAERRYKVAIDAFKRFVFPFAHAYYNELMLPSSIELYSDINNDTLDNLIHVIINKIEQMKLKLGEYKETVRKPDVCIGTGEFTSNSFFVWKNEEHKSMISKLLSGDTVTVKANIEHSAPDKDAIKFSVIEFDFKSKDENLQSEIDNALKEFKLDAVHFGNSYYRYGNEMYLITTLGWKIWYSFEKKPNGEPVRSSAFYGKIKNGRFMLSPYATWKITLQKNIKNVSFKDLEIYKDKIDLELRGYGHFVNKRTRNCSDLKVNNYYKAISTHHIPK